MTGLVKQSTIDLKIAGAAEGEARMRAIAAALDHAEKSAARLGANASAANAKLASLSVPAPVAGGAGAGGGSTAAAAASLGGAGAGEAAAGLGAIAAPAAAAAAAIYGTAKAGEALYAALGRGEKANAVADSFAALSEKVGGSASTLAALREASGGVVTDTDLMLSTNKLLVGDLGLSQEQIAKLTGAAVSMSRVMGTDANDAVNDLATGILRQSPAILDNLGIYVRSEEALKKFADAHGTTVEALDAETKKSIFLTETMKALDAAQAKTSAGGSSMASIAQSLSVKWENFTTQIDQLVAKQPGFAQALTATADAAIRIGTALTPLIELAGKAAAALTPVVELGGKAVALVAGSGAGLSAIGAAAGAGGAGVGSTALSLLGTAQGAASSMGLRGLTDQDAAKIGDAVAKAGAPRPGGSPFVNGYGG